MSLEYTPMVYRRGVPAIGIHEPGQVGGHGAEHPMLRSLEYAAFSRPLTPALYPFAPIHMSTLCCAVALAYSHHGRKLYSAGSAIPIAATLILQFLIATIVQIYIVDRVSLLGQFRSFS